MTTYVGTSTATTVGVNAMASNAASSGTNIASLSASTDGNRNPIAAYSSSTGGYPTIYALNSATTGVVYGVFGQSNASIHDTGYGVYGVADEGVGVRGAGYVGVSGIGRTGINAVSNDSDGVAVQAYVTANSSLAWAVYAVAAQSAAFAGYFSGKVSVFGTLYKTAGSFLIDHPLDPANRTLTHSFVESPDMKNIYDGVAVADDKGELVVEMPPYFEALDMDLRYQLTAIGGPAPNLHVKQKFDQGRFTIAGAVPGQEVCWQVTGIRQDAWAQKFRLPVEEEKPVDERGFYLNPEAFGEPPEKSVHRKRRAMRDEATQTPPVYGPPQAP